MSLVKCVFGFVAFAAYIAFEVSCACDTSAKSVPQWNGLKTTWKVYSPVPLNVNDAIQQGWVLNKDCSQGLGNRYVRENDTLILVFGANGAIAGVSVAIPKNLPFNFPSKNIEPYFVDEISQFTLNAYFFDPSTICSNQKQSYPYVGDRLVIKGDSLERRIPLTADEIKKEGFWTLGKCFPTMGIHYYADITGPLTVNTSADNMFPIGLLLNNGNLDGFFWLINDDLKSPRFEKPWPAININFFPQVPSFFYNTSLTPAYATTQHFYFDNQPELIKC